MDGVATRSVEPTDEPVDINEIREHVVCDDDLDFDQQLVRLARSAREHVEFVTWRSLMPQTWVLRFDCFPDSRIIELPRPPVTAVSSVQYYDSNDVLQTFASSNYQLDNDNPNIKARLALVDGADWPDTFARMNAVEITYTTGYASAAAIPQTLKDAILMITAHRFEYRGVATELRLQEVPMPVENTLMSYRVY